MSNFRSTFCWWPVLLVRHVREIESVSVSADGTEVRCRTGFEPVGWVWMQWLHEVRMDRGWVVLNGPKPTKLKFCQKCGQELPNQQGGVNGNL